MEWYLIRMKISLIYPYVSVAERYGADIGDIGGRQAPLGILSLSSWLKKKGHAVQLIDAEAERLPDDDLLRRLNFFLPDVVGMSITTVAYRNSVALACLVRKNFKDVKARPLIPQLKRSHQPKCSQKSAGQ
jgi:hypothetical protein